MKKPPAWEWSALFLLLASFLAFNLCTYTLYPNVWCDEVWFSEPAVNLVQHGSFTTTTWQFQPANTFPTVNCPLYSLALAPWMKLTGTSLLSVRSFNYALMAASAFLLWVISWRFCLVTTSASRLLMVGLLHLGYGISFAYRCSRPDILGLVCLSLLALSFGLKRRMIREACLLALAALTTWIGLQVSLFAWFASAMAWFLLRRISLRDLILISIGMSLGLASLLSFFAAKGVLSHFLPMVAGWLGKRYAHSPSVPLSSRAFTVLRDTLTSYVDDFTTLALTLGLGVLLALAWKRFSPAFRPFLVCMIVLIFVTPVLFNLVGHYAFYYSYVRFVPATLAFFGAWSALTGKNRSAPDQPLSTILLCALRFTFVTTLIAAVALGLPLRLAVTLTSSQLLPRSDIQRHVRSSIRPSDVVFTDHAPFFEIKQAATTVYDRNYSSSFFHQHIQGHDFTPEEKHSINVLVIRPAEAEFTTNFFGGHWQPVGAPFGDTQDFSKLASLPLVGPRLAHYGVQPQTERYQLQIFRRLPAARGSDPE